MATQKAGHGVDFLEHSNRLAVTRLFFSWLPLFRAMRWLLYDEKLIGDKP